jgi:hypothetical protein
MKPAGKMTAVMRPLGAMVLNLWISSLIPPGMVASLRMSTLSMLHTVAVGACLLVPASSAIVPALHVKHARRALVPLATLLESPEPRVVAPPDTVRAQDW